MVRITCHQIDCPLSLAELARFICGRADSAAQF